LGLNSDGRASVVDDEFGANSAGGQDGYIVLDASPHVLLLTRKPSNVGSVTNSESKRCQRDGRQCSFAAHFELDSRTTLWAWLADL